MKPEVGCKYIFFGEDSYVTDKDFHPIKLSGTHTLTKIRDSIYDRIKGRSMYLLDNTSVEVNIGKGSYIEQNCLRKVTQN